jgi:signal transduction histidine kinase
VREILTEIAIGTAKSIGTQFLADLVRSMREAMEASMVFVTIGLGDPPKRARSLASWQDGEALDAFEYDLDGTPCRLVFEGETVVISEGLFRQFAEKNKFEGYIGVPLLSSMAKVIGHLAVFSKNPLLKPQEGLAIVKLFALRAESELRRLEHEREREALIATLAQSNRRLASRHDALRQSNESKTMLLGMVAHDLRNPLSAILSRSEFIDALAGLPELAQEQRSKIQESCGTIMSTAERMDRLIASALAQAKNDAMAFTLDVQEFPVSRAVKLAVALNTPAAQRKSITIISGNTDDVAVRGDEDRIIEALDNLISNAVKYSHAGKTVSISVQELRDSIEVAVQDEGQGLTPEDCKRAFRQFQRLSAKPTAGETSTGLGLAIVKTIAEAHGGMASVLSAGKGKGACFTLSLPRARVQSLVIETGKADAP